MGLKQHYELISADRRPEQERANTHTQTWSSTDGNQGIEKEQITSLITTCVPANILNGTCIKYSACFQVRGSTSTEAIMFDVDNESRSHLHGRIQKRWV